MTTRIAIVGAGIAGLTCAYLLQPRYEILLFEQNDYLGGHAHAVQVPLAQSSPYVDTGFMVFNPRTYPNFMCLLQRLGVTWQPSNMSFSYRHALGDFEYKGHSINSFFAQRKHIITPSYYRFAAEIIRFNRCARQWLATGGDSNITLADFLQQQQFSAALLRRYLLPMLAAIWSAPQTTILQYPFYFLCRFLHNHGLLQLRNRPQWLTIQGSSKSYIDRMTHAYAENIYLRTAIKTMQRQNEKWLLATENDSVQVDKVILATHSDQALALLTTANQQTIEILSALKYQQNSVTLHTDSGLMPRRRRAWASWNYYDMVHQHDINSHQVRLTYYLNLLQNLRCREEIFVSVNQADLIKPQHIIAHYHYAHPCYTQASMRAQQQYHAINGQDDVYFCGAYWGYGFHEDGVNSALRVCQQLYQIPKCFSYGVGLC